jgi:hypothetical protein
MFVVVFAVSVKMCFIYALCVKIVDVSESVADVYRIILSNYCNPLYIFASFFNRSFFFICRRNPDRY